ncbi:MAG: glucose 1-dehydrogenase [Candidatus Geothermarchaeota archaeon]
MFVDFSNKIVLVTGGVRGIGRAIAEDFKRCGANVVVTYVKSDAIAKELSEKGIIAYKCDVGDREQVKNLAKFVTSKIGDVDILVNNAGVLHRMDFEEYDEALFNEMINVNLKGVIYTILELLPSLKKKKGVIVNVASIAGIGVATERTTYYAVTKAAVICLTKRLAYDLSKYGIRVNAVAPGFIETDLTLGGKTPEEAEHIKTSFANKSLLKTTGKPEDVSKLVLFLASDYAKFITGHTYVIDGGRMDYLPHGI